jgi:hypothetical protein
MRSTPTVLIPIVLIAACSAGTPATPTPEPGNEDWTLVIVDGDPGDGPAMSVSDALTHGPTDDVVAVSGFLFVDADDTAVLCEMILESFPPQCGGEEIAVEGLELGTLDLEEANGVRWAEGVVLLGSVE